MTQFDLALKLIEKNLISSQVTLNYVVAKQLSSFLEPDSLIKESN